MLKLKRTLTLVFMLLAWFSAPHAHAADIAATATCGQYYSDPWTACAVSYSSFWTSRSSTVTFTGVSKVSSNQFRCEATSVSNGASYSPGNVYCSVPPSCPAGYTLQADYRTCKQTSPDCNSSQWLNPATNQCDYKAICGPNSSYNAATNQCDPNPPLTCPTHQHDDGSYHCVPDDPVICPEHMHDDGTYTCVNDPPLTCPDNQHDDGTYHCVPNPPLACPQDQHDDGSYHCVANDALGCTSGQQRGFIDGQLQCIPRPYAQSPEAEQAQQAADAAKSAAEQAYDDYLRAKAAAEQLARAAAQNPGDPNLQAAASAAQNHANDLQTVAGNAFNDAGAAQAAADNLKGVAQESTLQRTDQSLETIKKALTSDRKANLNGDRCDSPPSCDGDPIQCAILKTTFAASCKGEDATQEMADEALGGPTEEEQGDDVSLASLDASGLGLNGGSCPAPKSYPIIGSANLSLDLSSFCQLAEIIGNLLLITAAFIALRILST